MLAAQILWAKLPRTAIWLLGVLLGVQLILEEPLSVIWPGQCARDQSKAK